MPDPQTSSSLHGRCAIHWFVQRTRGYNTTTSGQRHEILRLTPEIYKLGSRDHACICMPPITPAARSPGPAPLQPAGRRALPAGPQRLAGRLVLLPCHAMACRGGLQVACPQQRATCSPSTCVPLHAAAKRPAGFYGCTLTWFDSCHPMAYHAAVVCCIGSDAVARKCFRVQAASLPGLTELYRVQMLQVWVFVIQAPLLRAAIIPDFAGCMQTCLLFKDIPW